MGTGRYLQETRVTSTGSIVVRSPHCLESRLLSQAQYVEQWQDAEPGSASAEAYVRCQRGEEHYITCAVCACRSHSAQAVISHTNTKNTYDLQYGSTDFYSLSFVDVRSFVSPQTNT